MPSNSSKSTTRAGRPPKILLVTGAILIAYLVIGTILWAINTASTPGSAFKVNPLSALISPRAPLTLTLLHTNDTWGYTRPCG
jgi:hypothetical protein